MTGWGAFLERARDHAITWLDHRHFVPLCLVTYLLARALPIWLLPLTPTSDAAWYYERGRDLAAGLGFTEGGVPTAYWPVGWPAILGGLFRVFGTAPIVAQLANLVFATGTFFVVLALGRRLFSTRVAHLAVLLLAVYPNQAAYVSTLLTETAFTFLLLLGCWLYLRSSAVLPGLVTGVVFAAATMIKTHALPLPALLLAMRLWHGRTPRLRALAHSAVIAAVVAAAVVPWMQRNERVFGEPVFIATNGGMNLLLGNNPQAANQDWENAEYVRRADFSVEDQVAADRRARALAIDWIKGHPGEFAALLPLKALRLWARDGEAEWWYQRGYPHYQSLRLAFRSVRVVNQVLYVLLLAGWLIATVRLARASQRGHWRWLTTALIGYFTLIAMVFFGDPRFHFPVMPFVALHAAWAALGRHADTD